MEYTCEITVQRPIKDCVEIFSNPDMHKHWQRGLISLEHISGDLGEYGAKTKMIYKFGNKQLELMETITKNGFPHEFHATYLANGISNNQENYFNEIKENTTVWVCKNEFIPLNFTMRMMITLMPKGFKTQTMRYMKDFKKYAEKGVSILRN